MKTTIKCIWVLSCITFFSIQTLFGQIKTNKVQTKAPIQNTKIPKEKLTLHYGKLKAIPPKGGYILREELLYKAYLQVQRASLKKQQKLLLSSNKSKTTQNNKMSYQQAAKEMETISSSIEVMNQQDLKNQKMNEGNDCGGVFTNEICDKMKDIYQAQMLMEIGDLGDIRPCPEEDEHCFPIPFQRNIRHFLLPKESKFAAVFRNQQGKVIAKTGKPIAIQGVKDYVLYPVDLKKTTGNLMLSIQRSGFKGKPEQLEIPIQVQ